VTWRLSDQWTLSGAGTYVDARLTKDICGAVVNGNLVCGLGPSPLARSGEKLPVQPAFKADATLRYDFDVRDYRAYVQGSIQGQTSSRSFLPDVEATAFGDTAGFASFDFSAGVSRDNWTLDAFVQNAFDKRGQLSLNTVCSTTFCGPFARIYPIKPQFFGIKFGQKF
jgi:outer membrane receptor protein involved in Fe transport